MRLDIITGSSFFSVVSSTAARELLGTCGESSERGISGSTFTGDSSLVFVVFFD